MNNNLNLMKEPNVKKNVPSGLEGKKGLTIYLDNLNLRLFELDGEITSNQTKIEESIQKINKLEKTLDSLKESFKTMKSEVSVVSLNEFSIVKDQIKKYSNNLDKEYLLQKELNVKMLILKKEMDLIKAEANKTEKKVLGYGKVLDFRRAG
jgi:chromosome segregation ATPase